MKTILFILSVCLCSPVFSKPDFGRGKNAPKTNLDNNKYLGKWKGEESCKTVSAPVALLYVIDNGPEVILSGLYSLKGRVRAIVKGDTITIPRQEVKDPNFMNIFIEGMLTFGNKPFNVSGSIVVYNNQDKDECRVKYYK